VAHAGFKDTHPIHAADGHYARNSCCMTLSWLHHNHKMSISYHKNRLVSSRWHRLKKIALWYGYFDEASRLPTAYLSLCHDGKPFRFHVNCIHFRRCSRQVLPAATSCCTASKARTSHHCTVG